MNRVDKRSLFRFGLGRLGRGGGGSGGGGGGGCGGIGGGGGYFGGNVLVQARQRRRVRHVRSGLVGIGFGIQRFTTVTGWMVCKWPIMINSAFNAWTELHCLVLHSIHAINGYPVSCIFLSFFSTLDSLSFFLFLYFFLSLLFHCSFMLHRSICVATREMIHGSFHIANYNWDIRSTLWRTTMLPRDHQSKTNQSNYNIQMNELLLTVKQPRTRRANAIELWSVDWVDRAYTFHTAVAVANAAPAFAYVNVFVRKKIHF